MVLNFLKTSYNKVKTALTKTGSLLGNKLRSLLKGKINEETLEELEQLFYEADLGIQTSLALTEKVRDFDKANPSIETEELVEKIRQEVASILSDQPKKLTEAAHSPTVILVVGVNGNGKTTSVAKLTHYFQNQGKKVLVAATDTFRAAAIEQLETWAQRLNVDIVKGAPKSDPAAVAFDAITAAIARKIDIVIIDTAGRLHTRTDLMQELEKVKRACHKAHPESPHETLLVIDSTIGQNAIDQAKIFHKYTPISGLILTKLDGTAKGGIVVNIHEQLHIPIKFVGTGETEKDLEPFHPESFVQALFD